MNLTVACVWVRANVPYDRQYVENLRAMVRRHLSMPHEFICLANQPVRNGIRTYPVMHDPSVPGWWAKMELFRPGLLPGDRILYLDLDVAIVGSLEEIVHYSAAFALVPPGGSFNPPGYRTVRRFNSSVMVWDRGATDEVYGRYATQSDLAQPYWGDQDFIGDHARTAVTMPAEWFPRFSELRGEPPASAKVVLVKKPKPHIAARKSEWLRRAWEAA
jgi:hypothetical protein